MKKRFGVAVVMFMCGSGCGRGPDASSPLESPLDDAPVAEEPNACGSVVERDLASLAVFVAEELGHWDAAEDFELDPVTGNLRLSARGRARCVGTCSQTESMLALQRPEA